MIQTASFIVYETILAMVVVVVLIFGLLQLLTNSLHGLGNPEVQFRIFRVTPIILILSQINPIARIDTYFFKVHFNIVVLKVFSLYVFPVKI